MAKQSKADFPQESWNKKRLLISLILVIVLIVGALELKVYVLGKDYESEDIKGVSISPAPTIVLPSAENVSQGIGKSILNIKQELDSINVQEIATSSPQVQKILNDIKELPAVPGQQAKDMCVKLCENL